MFMPLTWVDLFKLVKSLRGFVYKVAEFSTCPGIAASSVFICEVLSYRIWVIIQVCQHTHSRTNVHVCLVVKHIAHSWYVSSFFSIPTDLCFP